MEKLSLSAVLLAANQEKRTAQVPPQIIDVKKIAFILELSIQMLSKQIRKIVFQIN